MDLLDKLFSYEYFETILFIVIGVLLFLFVLVFILGKKDEKKRRKIKEAEENASASSAFDTDITKANELVNNDLEEPVKTDDRFKGFDDININALNTMPEDSNKIESEVNNGVVNYEVPMDDVVVNTDEPLVTNEESVIKDDHDFDLASLEATLNSINDVPVDSEPEAIPKEEVIEPVIPQKQPEVFSSVFVNKAPEAKKVVDESQIELPKKVEMPTLKEEKTTNSFPDFEEETYKIK